MKATRSANSLALAARTSTNACRLRDPLLMIADVGRPLRLMIAHCSCSVLSSNSIRQCRNFVICSFDLPLPLFALIET